ncbi:MAG: pilus assembly protein PilM [Dehalococcoidia bacterium]|nr:pilus assembly protein PilM [Dehalococcoidia bacterium]
MARDAIAIYIDDSGIRMLSAGGRRPREWAVEPLEPGLVRDGFIVDEPAVAAKVRTLWARVQPGSQQVVAGISGINCLYRFLTLPVLPKNLLPEAVKREASRALGVPLEQLYISWQTLPGQPEETLVYIAAAARTTVDGVIRTLKRANLNPYMMDIAPLALTRATAEANALIIDLQPAGMDIVVKIGGMPEVIRSVSISRAASVNDHLSAVRQELQRAVTFFNSSHPDNPLSDDVPILVAGDLADQKDLWPSLLGKVERRVDAIRTPMEATADFVPSVYAPLVGLVLKETVGRAAETYSRINFNALPEAYIPKPRPLSQLLYPPALLVGVLGVAAIGYMVYNSTALTEALRERDAANNQMVITLNADIGKQRQVLEAERAALEADVTAKEARVAALDSQLRGFTEDKQEMNGDLGEINKTPGGVNLSSISHGGSVADILGSGADEQSVFTYARQLRSSGRWSLVVINSMTAEDVRTAFAITLYR